MLRTKVDQVEILEVRSVPTNGSGGLVVDAAWTHQPLWPHALPSESIRRGNEHHFHQWCVGESKNESRLSAAGIIKDIEVSNIMIHVSDLHFEYSQSGFRLRVPEMRVQDGSTVAVIGS